MIIILYLSQIAQRCCQVRNGRPYDRPCGARFQRPTRTRVSTAPKTSCNSLAFRRVSSEGHVNISTEGQPGSDLSAERQPVSDWSKWLHVTIMWLLWTSIFIQYSISLFFRRSVIFLTKREKKSLSQAKKGYSTHIGCGYSGQEIRDYGVNIISRPY